MTQTRPATPDHLQRWLDSVAPGREIRELDWDTSWSAWFPRSATVTFNRRDVRFVARSAASTALDRTAPYGVTLVALSSDIPATSPGWRQLRTDTVFVREGVLASVYAQDGWFRLSDYADRFLDLIRLGRDRDALLSGEVFPQTNVLNDAIEEAIKVLA